MATFQAQVEALSGAVTSTTELSSWLSAGANDVVHRVGLINRDKLYQFAVQSTAFTSNAGMTTESVLELLDVSRNGYPAYEIPPALRKRAVDALSIHKCTALNPGYYKLNNTLYVLPAPTGTEGANVSYVAPYTVLYSASSIPSFPTGAEDLVVIYAAMQNLKSLISDMTFPTDLTLPSVPALVNANSTVTVPTAPTLVALTAISITLPSAPTYTKPTISADVANFVTTITTQIDTNEDPELAQVKLGELDAVLKRWQTDIQDEQNEFAKDNAIFQATIQKLIEEAKLKTQEETSQAELLIRDYAEKVQAYTAHVNAIASDNASIVGLYRGTVEVLVGNYTAQAQVRNSKLTSYLALHDRLEKQYEDGFVPFKVARSANVQS